MGDRARGVVLYTCAALLLAGGGVWWVRAAPRQVTDSRIAQWQQDAQRLLPDDDEQRVAGTVPLAAGADHEVVADLDTGEYRVSVICVGGAESQVRVSLGDAGTDSGRGLDCEGGSEPNNFTVGTAGQLRMNVTVGAAGPVVFRYSLLPETS
ncbi:DUF6023 family protein [Actinoplanes sp. NPDC026619]|uniref:DUF6023 family protein n=1 Tax=Actinoplanes sp. NPDC026619 TaxID=3155798 RepID=UPI0033C41837